MVGKGDGVYRGLWGMGLGMDGVVRGKEGWCVWGGALSYWLVQMLGEGQSQTILSPAVGKSRETKRGGGYVFQC